jgi:cyclophilin family peptidyl-prolyl cis-trans isomerase
MNQSCFLKYTHKILIMWALTFVFQPVFSQSKKDYLVTITTKFGDMNLILFDKTPKHKANFLKLINDKVYDSTLFHRVIQNFMIQGGDPTSKNAKPGIGLGGGDIGYRIPAEILPELYHKKGALAAARSENPAKESSGSQFYIVHGKTWASAELESQIKRSGRVFTDEQKRTYNNVGGAPHLDGNYTVFGQLISGMAVLDSIANIKKGAYDRPELNVIMTMKAQKMRKKKILKKYLEKSVSFTF